LGTNVICHIITQWKPKCFGKTFHPPYRKYPHKYGQMGV